MYAGFLGLAQKHLVLWSCHAMDTPSFQAVYQDCTTLPRSRQGRRAAAGLSNPAAAWYNHGNHSIKRRCPMKRGEHYEADVLFFFDGHPLAAEDVMRIGYLPEERGLYKKMKVGEQAIYLARLKGLTHAEAKRRLTEWFERFDIMPWWDKKLEELSKGMQQKVQFIITVLHEPPLLIFDEPFSGFDPVNAERLKQEILRLKEEGHTVIFSTHNMASVEEICDEIALINHAQVVLSGNVSEVKSRFRTGLYELTCTGPRLESEAGSYEVTAAHQVAGVDHYRLRKADALTNSELVALLAGRVEVRAFSELLPSMNDIFLKTVGGDASASKQQTT